MGNESTGIPQQKKGMSKGKWIFIVLTLLIATNIITFGWTTFRYREEIQQREDTIRNLEKQIVKIGKEQAELKATLKRLQIWESFITVQRDLGKINSEINDLNFGNAIRMIESLKKKIRSGELGEQFKKHEEKLLAILDHAIQQLKNKNEDARDSLIAFNESAFRILAGISPLAGEQASTEKAVASEKKPKPETPQPEEKASPTSEDKNTENTGEKTF